MHVQLEIKNCLVYLVGQVVLRLCVCLCVVGSGMVVGFGYYGCSPKRFWGLAPKCRRRICRSFSSHRRSNFACHCYLRYTPVKPTSQTRRNPPQLTAIHHSQNYGKLRLERCLHCLYELEAFHLFTSTYGLLPGVLIPPVRARLST